MCAWSTRSPAMTTADDTTTEPRDSHRNGETAGETDPDGSNTRKRPSSFAQRRLSFLQKLPFFRGRRPPEPVDDDKNRDPEASAELLNKESGPIKTISGVEFQREKDDEYGSEVTVEGDHLLERLVLYARHRLFLFALIVLLCVLLVVVIVAVMSLGGGPRHGDLVLAHTTCGPVHGLWESHAAVFRGVPYAVPPVGDLRWKPSQLPSNLDHCWQGTYSAVGHNKLCMQRPLPWPFSNVQFSEDCLYVDIYTPRVTYGRPMPVVVYFAGDSFQGHDITDYKWRPTAELVKEHDVVYVVVYYRMNAFGFLASHLLTRNVHPPTSGNYGFYDMITALRWVQKNIDSFGGDASRVTVLGHGSGATGILAVLSTRFAKRLFSQAWITGGSADFVNKTLSDAERDNESFNRYLICDKVECLYSKTSQEVLSAIPTSEWPFWGSAYYLDLPTSDENIAAIAVIDGDIVHDLPSVMWDNGDYNEATLVVGSALHSVGARPLVEEFDRWNWTDFKNYIEYHLNTFGVTVTEEALERYQPQNRTPQATYVQMVSDLRVTCPLQALALRAARRFADAVYFYINQYAPDGRLPPSLVSHGQKLAIHGLDIMAIFGRIKDHIANPSQRDLQFEKNLQKRFYDFVHHGQLSEEAAPKPKLPRYINILGSHGFNRQSYPHPNCDFWAGAGMYPKFGRMN